MLSSNWTVSVFNHQYLQKELINLLGFLHRNKHKRNDKSETNIFNCIWPSLAGKF